MSTGKTARLRIYCICGQKMKVSAAMYGRPGKCVACRQKIRIPRADELEPETREIHLKDHPEFLRMPSGRSETGPEEVSQGDIELIPLGEEDRQEVSVPVEILEPLQILAAMEARVVRRLKALGDAKADGDPALDRQRQDLQTQRKRIERARSELDESMRQRLMEVAIELTTVQQRLAELNLNVRVGELDFNAFRESSETMRRRRDKLELRQLNLRGWLAVRDPYLAGGLAGVPDDKIPIDLDVRFTGELDSPQSRLEEFVEALREALERRESAERKLGETEKIRGTALDSSSRLEEAREECRGAVKLAQAGIAFYRGRLEQLRSDYASDLQAIESQAELARGRLQVGEITRVQFDDVEGALLRAKSDLVKAIDLARRALSAPSAHDVPQARGTFLQRLSPKKPLVVIGPDTYLGWIAGFLFALVVLLPVPGGLSPISAYNRIRDLAPDSIWLILAPASMAVFAFLASVLPWRMTRGIAYSLAALLSVVALALYCFDSSIIAGPLEELAGGGVALLQPGVIVAVLAVAALFAGSFVALAGSPSLRLLPFAAIVLSCVAAAIIVITGENGEPKVSTDGVGEGRSQSGLDVDVVPEPVAPSEKATDVLATPAETPAVSPGPIVPGLTEPPTDVEAAVPTPGPSQATSQNVQVKLRGVLAAPGREPRFTFAIYAPGLPPEERMVRAGDPLYGVWSVLEYNTSTKTVTIGDGNQILIVRSGERMSLPGTP